MDTSLTALWVYLAETPLLWLTITLITYYLAEQLQQRVPWIPLFNPVLLSIVGLVLLLWATNTPYPTYFDGAQFVHFLLGPATVALALPLYTYQATLRRMLLPLIGALGVGSLTGIGSAVLIGQWLGLSEITVRSLAPKSITTPIAMGVSEQVGGLPSLTAVIVILTGIVGATLAREVFTVMRVREPGICGFALGISAHGIGTARALQMNAEAGAFSGLAMGLNGVITAILVPLVLPILIEAFAR